MSKKKVLLVDDNPQVRDVLKTHLEEIARCEVITAPDGNAAIRVLDEKEPHIDVAVLDIFMRTHGMAVAEYLKRHPRYRNTKIVFITGLDERMVDKSKFSDAMVVRKGPGAIGQIIRFISSQA